jgi:hypothetical protein
MQGCKGRKRFFASVVLCGGLEDLQKNVKPDELRLIAYVHVSEIRIDRLCHMC